MQWLTRGSLWNLSEVAGHSEGFLGSFWGGLGDVYALSGGCRAEAPVLHASRAGTPQCAFQ